MAVGASSPFGFVGTLGSACRLLVGGFRASALAKGSRGLRARAPRGHAAERAGHSQRPDARHGGGGVKGRGWSCRLVYGLLGGLCAGANRRVFNRGSSRLMPLAGRWTGGRARAQHRVADALGLVEAAVLERRLRKAPGRGLSPRCVGGAAGRLGLARGTRLAPYRPVGSAWRRQRHDCLRRLRAAVVVEPSRRRRLLDNSCV